jgi:hypothetical protein
MSSIVVPAPPGKPDSVTEDLNSAVLPRPHPSFWRLDAPVAVVMLFVGSSLNDYDRLIAGLDLTTRGSALPGCLFHWATGTPEGVRITEVWRNIKIFDFFIREDVLPTVTALRLPDPEVSVFAVHHFLTEGSLSRRPEAATAALTTFDHEGA